MLDSCPLCEYCGERQLDCEGSCPLAENHRGCHYFLKWFEAKTKEDRQKYATIIYDKINEWDITKRVKQNRMNKGY